MSKFIIHNNIREIYCNNEYNSWYYESILNRVKGYKLDHLVPSIKQAINQIYAKEFIAEVNNQEIIRIFSKDEVIKLMMLS